MDDLPVACTLTSDDLRARRDDLLPGLLRQATERVETPTGYRYQFAMTSEMLPQIASVVAQERQCCRFFTFVIALEPNLGPITLDVSGPEGTEEFLADLPA